VNRKLVLALTLTLLVGTLSVALDVQRAKASGTIYIRANGLVEGTDKIATADNVTYTFADNISDSIVVERDNIMIDGAGYALQRAGFRTGVGIELSERRNVKVTNTTIQNFDYGINSSSSSPFSSNNSIVGNKIINTRYGIHLEFSSNNSITGNVFTGCGLLAYGSYGNLVEDNLVNGKPLVYLEDVSDYVVEDAGQVILLNCNNIRIESLNLSNTNFAIQLGGTNNTIIVNNQITASNHVESGILLSASSNNNSIVGNNITRNSFGVWLESFSNNNSIVGNDIADNMAGMFLGGGSCNNRIFHNNFVNNTEQATSDGTSADSWDNGYPSGGNYWSDYSGSDLYSGSYQNETGSDGVGDVSYGIDANNTDRFPLMGPDYSFDAGTWNSVRYRVDIVSNSTVSGFYFNASEGAFLMFTVTGEEGTEGFCRVTIPKDLLWTEDGWTVVVQYPLFFPHPPPSSFEAFSDENCTYLYLTYTNPSQNLAATVTINGTHVIPESPSFLILPLFFIATLLAVIVHRRKHS
jgi:parallel beta-helix repeat protein